jgi:hypothetical protein
MRIAFALAAALGSMTLAAPASAQGTPAESPRADAVSAQRLFNEGLDALARRDFARACAKLEGSQRLDPAVGTLVKWSECEELRGRLMRAERLLSSAIGLAKAKQDRRLGAVEQRMAQIEARIPKLNVVLGNAPSPGLRVSEDDELLGPERLGVDLPADPGAHRLTASAPGKKAWSTTMMLPADGSTLRVAVPPLEDDPGPESAGMAKPAPLPDEARPRHRARRPGESSLAPAVVSFGVGAAGLGVGGVTGLLAFLAASDATSHCLGTTCMPAAESGIHGAKTFATASDIGFAIGAAGVLAGVVFLVFPPRSHPTTGVHFVVGPTSASLAGVLP